MTIFQFSNLGGVCSEQQPDNERLSFSYEHFSRQLALPFLLYVLSWEFKLAETL